jgi:hypothetical protein
LAKSIDNHLGDFEMRHFLFALVISLGLVPVAAQATTQVLLKAELGTVYGRHGFIGTDLKLILDKTYGQPRLFDTASALLADTAQTDGTIAYALDTHAIYIMENSTWQGVTVASGGNSSISGTLGVSGATTLQSTVAITGATTATGAVYANGGVDRSTAAALAVGATNATAINIGATATPVIVTPAGAVTVPSTLAVTGATTATGAIRANGGVDRSTAADLAIGATNATNVKIGATATPVTVTAAGAVTIPSTLGVTGSISPTGGMTMTIANGANTACNTTCGGKACVIGFDAGASAFVACATATADTCICGP